MPPPPPHFTSPSRRAGAAAEAWASENLYCPSCGVSGLAATPTNTKVLDFACSRCALRLQLKAKKGRFGGAFANSAYAPKIEAIRARRMPDYALVSYDPRQGSVTGLTFLPGHFLTEQAVQARKPLSSTARRAGWVGSNVLLRALPADALVWAVRDQVVRPAREVVAAYRRFDFLRASRAEAAGWTTAVLKLVREAGPEGTTFSLQDFYGLAEGELARQFPSNQHVQAKIRQQLQVLRDAGVLSFEGRGRYRVIG